MSPWPKFYWIMWHLRKNRYVQYPFYTISQLLKDFKLSSDPKEKRYNHEGLRSNLVKYYLKSLRLLNAKHMEVYFPFLLTVVLSRPMVLSFHGIFSIHCCKFSALTTFKMTEKSRATIITARAYLQWPQLTSLLSKPL